MKYVFPLLLATLLCGQVLADDLAKPNCTQPPVPGKFTSDSARKKIDKNVKIYRACMVKFIEEQQEVLKNATEIPKANKAHDAAEAAIKELNEFTDKINGNEEE